MSERRIFLTTGLPHKKHRVVRSRLLDVPDDSLLRANGIVLNNCDICNALAVCNKALDHEGLSPKGRNKSSPERIERPLDVEYRFRAGRGDIRLNKYLFLGLSSDEF